MLNPAKTVIEICGGVPNAAKLANRSENRVRRWTYERERGGTGGLIPADCQVALLDGARREGINLRPEHFFAEATATDGAQ